MFFTRSVLIKIKNYLIFCYIIFLLFHGTNRCLKTRTFSALYDYFYFYLTKEIVYIKEKQKISFIENKKNIFHTQNINVIKKVCIWCRTFKITIINFYNILKTMYTYNIIFSYFYTNNLKTDIITIRNDIEICYNNLFIPLFWGILFVIRRI